MCSLSTFVGTPDAQAGAVARIAWVYVGGMSVTECSRQLPLKSEFFQLFEF